MTCREPSLQSSLSVTDANDATACLAVNVDRLLYGHFNSHLSKRPSRPTDGMVPRH